MAMKTAPKRKLVSMMPPREKLCEKETTMMLQERPACWKTVLIPKLWTSALMISA